MFQTNTEYHIAGNGVFLIPALVLCEIKGLSMPSC